MGHLFLVFQTGFEPAIFALKGQRLNRLSTGTFYCGTGWNRTSDTRIFSAMLYQLSYRPMLFYYVNELSFCKTSNYFLNYQIFLNFFYFFVGPPRVELEPLVFQTSVTHHTYTKVPNVLNQKTRLTFGGRASKFIVI